jgi:transcriptional regulator of arginine metabolism
LLRRSDTDVRRTHIIRLIRQKRVGTQDELRALLLSQGIDVTQATLSRDLARLGARRVGLAEGGTAYELESMPVASLEDPLLETAPMVIALDHNDAMVVIQTVPGAASAAARAIDMARLDSALGTLAGDDTIFVAPRRGVSAAKLFRVLKERLQK